MDLDPPTPPSLTFQHLRQVGYHRCHDKIQALQRRLYPSSLYLRNMCQSVRQAFKLCRETWDLDEEFPNSGSVALDVVAADASLTATSSANCNSIWDKDDELVDVSEWTHGQVGGVHRVAFMSLSLSRSY